MIQVTVKASLHTPACKHYGTRLQAQLARRLVPAHGGQMKTCCGGKLNVAWSPPPATD